MKTHHSLTNQSLDSEAVHATKNHSRHFFKNGSNRSQTTLKPQSSLANKSGSSLKKAKVSLKQFTNIKVPTPTLPPINTELLTF